MPTAREVYRVFRRSSPDPRVLFDPTRATDVLDVPDIQRLLDDIPEGFLANPADAVLFTLRTLTVQESDLNPQLVNVDLVGTVPGGMNLGIRATRMVVREMLREASQEIFVFGFEVSDQEFIEILAEVAATVPVRLLVDREQGSADRITDEWPPVLEPPAIYTNRPDRGGFAYEKMHSKGILVDGEDLLITSANLTHHGMEGKFELGVRLRGDPARRMAETVERLLESKLVDRWNSQDNDAPETGQA